MRVEKPEDGKHDPILWFLKLLLQPCLRRGAARGDWRLYLHAGPIDMGVTVLLVEQNSNMSLKIAHRGYVLENGVTVMNDSAQALLKLDVVRASYLGE